MSFTNETQNYHLPQWVGSDKPTWLVDLNGAFSDIDTGMAATQAQSDATDVVVAGHTSAITALQNTTSDQGSAITGLRTDVDHNTGDISTINSLIGNGTPTTTDKTIIGAINELHSDVTGLDTPYYVIIGDSLANGEHSGNPDGGWARYFKEAMGLTEGVDCFTTAVSGKGWTTSGVNFLTMAQALTTSDDSKVGTVIVLGGLNDYQTSFQDEYSAANTLYGYLHTRFPNASIKFGVIGRSRDTAAINTALEESIIPAIKNSYAEYIVGSDLFGRWYDKYTDTWHWNNDYTMVFGLLLAAGKCKKVQVDNGYRDTVFTADSDFATANNPIAKMRQNESAIIIPEATTRLFQYTTDKAFSAGNFIEIPLGTLRSNIAGDGKRLVPVSGYVGFSAPTNEFFPYTGYLCFTAGTNGNSDLTLKMGAVFSGDTSYVARTIHNFTIDVAAQSVDASFC